MWISLDWRPNLSHAMRHCELSCLLLCRLLGTGILCTQQAHWGIKGGETNADIRDSRRQWDLAVLFIEVRLIPFSITKWAVPRKGTTMNWQLPWIAGCVSELHWCNGAMGWDTIREPNDSVQFDDAVAQKNSAINIGIIEMLGKGQF